MLENNLPAIIDPKIAPNAIDDPTHEDPSSSIPNPIS